MTKNYLSVILDDVYCRKPGALTDALEDLGNLIDENEKLKTQLKELQTLNEHLNREISGLHDEIETLNVTIECMECGGP